MWADFQQCHPEGAKLQKAESITSIKLGNYTKACVKTVGRLHMHWDENTSGEQHPVTQHGG